MCHRMSSFPGNIDCAWKSGNMIAYDDQSTLPLKHVSCVEFPSRMQ